MDLPGLSWILKILFLSTRLISVSLRNLDQLSSHELFHLFGANSTDSISTAFLNSPIKISLDNGASIFIIDYFNERYVFSLIPLSLYDKNYDSSRTCTYHGVGLSHPGSTLALVDCTGSKRGLMVTSNGDILLFHPLPPTRKAQHDHVIHKRESWQNVSMLGDKITKNDTCLFDGASYSRRNYKNESRLPVAKGPLTVEIALFADEKLWEHFKQIYGSTDAENELHSFVLAAVNNVNLLFNHRTLEPKVQLKIKRYHVLKDAPPLLSEDAHKSGDVDILLENFCQYQNSFNPPQDDDPSHWDHALLFTGYDLYRGSLKTVAGYAPVKGMCSGSRSCTINEGLDFGSVFVITHEMGHSLGMFHDGDNGCDVGCCIMSPSVGAGKTAWSACSVEEFNEFLREMGTPLAPPNCLLDGESETANLEYSLQGEYPGQRYNADQQCRFYHGSCWKQELRDGQRTDEICSMIWCGEGEGLIRTAHPALEGTYCGDNKWCQQGQCRPWPNGVPPEPIHGSWSPWNDAPSDGCHLNCDAPCRIEGQIMIKRSVRLCENPSPNNGGKPCEGAAYRGFICSDSTCRGPSAGEFATVVCTNLRDGTGSAGSAVLQFTGRGFQHQEQLCRVWCQLRSGSFARSVGNFPDGTPCGRDRFCIRGLCMKKSCDGVTLVMDDSDCPTSDESASKDLIQATDHWSQWNLWSECSVTCGTGGLRQRTRTCKDGLCKGPQNEMQHCRLQQPCQNTSATVSTSSNEKENQQNHILNVWLPWSQWSACDATCGFGLRQRTRTCGSNACFGPALQSKVCELGECPAVGAWTSWESWTKCSKPCGTGTQDRRRFCRGNPSCEGNNLESKQCNLELCQTSTSSPSGTWTSWSQWSICSRSCGSGGVRYRLRSCSASRCIGSNVSFSGCNTFDCPDSNSVAAAIIKE